ncbi:MAG: hypothetical protein ACT4OJ_02560 [Bacteroidota bacterium]
MKKTTGLVVAAAMALFSVNSCSKSSGGGGGGGTTTVNCANVTNKAFTADVLPILQSSCAISGCHAAGSTNGPGALTSHAQASAAASSIRSAVSSGRMPQSGTLTTAQKNSIICWVDSGAPNN